MIPLLPSEMDRIGFFQTCSEEQLVGFMLGLFCETARSSCIHLKTGGILQ